MVEKPQKTFLRNVAPYCFLHICGNTLSGLYFRILHNPIHNTADHDGGILRRPNSAVCPHHRDTAVYKPVDICHGIHFH